MIKRIKSVLLLTLMLVLTAQVSAKTTFYDSKSWIINVAGDTQCLINMGFGPKINPVTSLTFPEYLTGPISKSEGKEIAKKLTAAGYGKKFIDALTNNGTSDRYLKKLSLINSNKQDMELGAENIKSTDESMLTETLADNYEDVLLHNYIVLAHTSCYIKDGKKVCSTYYAIFKVDITKEEAFDIVSHINTPEYGSFKFPISFCSSGWVNEDALADISKEIPDFAIRGVLLQRSPAKISIGENAGLSNGDLVTVFSQRVDGKGQPYSKPISRARVVSLGENESYLNFESRLSGNRKNGDIVVRTPDNHTRLGIMANYSPHVWGGQLFTDTKVGFTKAGIIHHILVDLGFYMTDKPGDDFYVIKGSRAGTKYSAPLFFNGGFGYGISKIFLGYLDVMPYFMAQYEPALMAKSGDESNGYYEDDSSAIFAQSIRVPIGVRFGFNLKYPVKLLVEGGYAFRFGFGDDYKIVKQSCEYIGAKRDGFFVGLGFIF